MGSCGISLLVCLETSTTLKKNPLVLSLNFAVFIRQCDKKSHSLKLGHFDCHERWFNRRSGLCLQTLSCLYSINLLAARLLICNSLWVQVTHKKLLTAADFSWDLCEGGWALGLGASRVQIRTGLVFSVTDA